jgi:hypothetical protein
LSIAAATKGRRESEARECIDMSLSKAHQHYLFV